MLCYEFEVKFHYSIYVYSSTWVPSCRHISIEANVILLSIFSSILVIYAELIVVLCRLSLRCHKQIVYKVSNQQMFQIFCHYHSLYKIYQNTLSILPCYTIAIIVLILENTFPCLILKYRIFIFVTAKYISKVTVSLVFNANFCVILCRKLTLLLLYEQLNELCPLQNAFL